MKKKQYDGMLVAVLILGLTMLISGIVFRALVTEPDRSDPKDPISGTTTPSQNPLSKKQFEYTFTINPTLPKYMFTAHVDETNKVFLIEVASGDGEGEARVRQELRPSTVDQDPYITDKPFFEAVDFNFDGYKDIQLMTWSGATGNAGYEIWLFNEGYGFFERSRELSELPNATPRPDTKHVESYMKGGLAGAEYTLKRYRYAASGQLELVYEESQTSSCDGACLLKVVREMKQGVMTETIRREISMDEFRGEF